MFRQNNHYVPTNLPSWVIEENRQKSDKVKFDDTSGIGSENKSTLIKEKEIGTKTPVLGNTNHKITFKQKLNTNKGKLLYNFYKVIGSNLSLFSNIDQFDNFPPATQHMIMAEYTRMIKSGYGRKWTAIDVESFKDRQYKRPCQRLRESLVKTKKVKEKIPLHYREIILENMEKNDQIEEQFDNANMPDNVKKAMSMF
jgi:hypothetical protein